MPLYRLLQNQPFGPEQIEAMACAFEAICHERQLRVGRDDAQRELIAQLVIDYAQRGERDPFKLKHAVEAARSRNRPPQLVA